MYNIRILSRFNGLECSVKKSWFYGGCEMKFKIWDKKENEMKELCSMSFSYGDLNTIEINDIDGCECDYELRSYSNNDCIILKDTGLRNYWSSIIFESDVVKFKLKTGLNQYLELKGYFKWNKQELRYEINILNNDTYIKLYYNSSTMSNFETIGNIYQNPELLNV